MWTSVNCTSGEGAFVVQGKTTQQWKRYVCTNKRGTFAVMWDGVKKWERHIRRSNSRKSIVINLARIKFSINFQFLHFGSYLEQYWVNSDKIKCILSRKTREIQRKQYFSSSISEIFPGVLSVFWYRCIWFRHFSACNFIYIYRPSYPLSGDMIILCVEQIDLELWSISQGMVVHVQFSAKRFCSVVWTGDMFEMFHMSCTK